MPRASEQEERMKRKHSATRLVLEMLVSENDELKLHPRAAEAFERGLEALFEDPQVDEKGEIEQLLRLVAVLEKRESFGAADGVMSMIANSARACAALGIARPGTIVGKRRFAAFAGERRQFKAPKIDAAVPAGAIKASSFLDPGRERGSRAARR
jgi:hypothetical protein